jgi:hypothetical protein
MASDAPTSSGISMDRPPNRLRPMKSERNEIEKTDTVQIQNRLDRKNGNRGIHADTNARPYAV